MLDMSVRPPLVREREQIRPGGGSGEANGWKLDSREAMRAALPAVAQMMEAQNAASARQQRSAVVQRQPADPNEPVVQAYGLGDLGSALWSLGAGAASFIAAHPYIAAALGAGALGAAGYAYYNRETPLTRRRGQRGIEDLPKDQLWRMYINPKDFAEAGATEEPGKLYDNQKSPGFQKGMERALVEELQFGSNRGKRKVDFKEYTRLHDLVSSGLKSGTFGESDTRETTRGLSSGENLYLIDGKPYTEAEAMNVAGTSVIPLPPVTFPINDWDKTPTPLAGDLVNETIGGRPMVGGGALNTSVVKQDGNELGVNYDLSQGPVITQQIFDRYYDEVGKADSDDAKLRAIVKAIRAVHVTHAFRDANGRLNVQILLNRFLLEQGFDPTILPEQGLGMFGGGFSVEQLAGAVKGGSKRFRALTDSKKEK